MRSPRMSTTALAVPDPDPGKGIAVTSPAHDWILPLIERRSAQLEDPPRPPGGPTTAAAPGSPDDGATPTKVVIYFDPLNPAPAADQVLEHFAVEPAGLYFDLGAGGLVRIDVYSDSLDIEPVGPRILRTVLSPR